VNNCGVHWKPQFPGDELPVDWNFQHQCLIGFNFSWLAEMSNNIDELQK
jgi:hypothetical protein